MSDTRQIILETLSQHGPLPLAEIARVARRSPLALRYHLAQLLAAELVVTANVQRRAGVGRPQMLYTLAENAHEHLPKQYAWLAEQLLTEICAMLGEKETRALLRRAGRRNAAAAPALRPGARLETRLRHAVAVLTARGYLAHWEKTDGTHTLYVCHCPYYHVARTQNTVCELDLTFITTLLAAPTKLARRIADGETQCCFTVKPKPAARNQPDVRILP